MSRCSKAPIRLRSWISFLYSLDTGDKNWNALIESQLNANNFMWFLLLWLRTAIEHGLSHGDLLNCIYFVKEKEPRLLVSEGFEFKKSEKQDQFYQEDLDAVRHIFFLLINRCSTSDLLKINNFDNAPLTEDIVQRFVELHSDLKSFDINSCIPRVALNPPFLWHPNVMIHHIRRASKYFFHNDKKILKSIRGELKAFDLSSAWSGWKDIVKGADETNVIKRFYDQTSIEKKDGEDNEEHSEMVEVEESHKIFYNGCSGLLRFGCNTIEHLNEALNEVLSEVRILSELNELVNFSRRLAVGMHDYVKGLSTEMQSWFLDEVAFPN